MTKYVTQAELVEAVKQATGANTGTTFIGADMETVCDLVGGKKNPYQGAIKRSVGLELILGFDYEKSVQNQQEKSDLDRDFKAGERVNHLVRTDHRNILVNEAGTMYYLWVKVKQFGHASYYFKGTQVARELLNIRESKMANTQVEAGLTKENEVVVKNYKFSSILALRMNGDEYKIVERMSQEEKERAVEAALTPVNV